MTGPASPPSDTILLPLGQPLGSVVEPDGRAYLRVRLGGDIHRLDGSSAVMWRALHRAGASRAVDRALVEALDGPAIGVADPLAEVELLQDLGLAVELAVGARKARRAFADGVRLLPLHTVLGNAESNPDDFALIAGGTQRTAIVDAGMREVLSYAPRETDLYGTCYVRSGAFHASETLAGLADPDAFIEHVLTRVHPLLAVHAAYFDLAIHPDSPAHERAARVDPATVPIRPAADDDEDDQGIYAVGYLAGARYMWLGLESINIRVSELELELATEEAWLSWTAAHGVAVDDGVDDSEEAICNVARGAGALAPIFELDDQQARGMIVRPDGEAGTVEFAATHRLEPLLCGLGNTAADPGRYRLGVTEEHPLVELSEREHEVWRDAHLSASLLDAAHAAGCAGSAGELRDYLRVVQVLSLRRAAFIDGVRW